MGSPKKEFNPDDLSDFLPIYYKRLYPFNHMYRWLAYGNPPEHTILTNRDITMTLQNDIYVRYQSIGSQEQLKATVLKMLPIKIDIGAVWSHNPKDIKTIPSMRPVQRELVFDIDMTDYDNIRTCCEGAEVCIKCWKFMTVACRILNTGLRDDFGFKHILWVFSGRRGIHCWVCDEEARLLDEKARSAIAEYFYLVTASGKDNEDSKVSLGEKIHHSIKRALKVIEPLFEEICLIDQNIFANATGRNKLLQMISDENFRKDLGVYLESQNCGDSKAVWDAFVRYVNSARVQSTLPRNHKHIVEEVQLAFTYPRLDINVSKGMSHLLKAPFCIHPKTGKVCVPFNPNVAEKFDPTTVPTINVLLDEVNAFDDKNKPDDDNEEKSKIKDFKKTSMLKGVVLFDEFLQKLELACKRKAAELSVIKMEF